MSWTSTNITNQNCIWKSAILAQELFSSLSIGLTGAAPQSSGTSALTKREFRNFVPSKTAEGAVLVLLPLDFCSGALHHARNSVDPVNIAAVGWRQRWYGHSLRLSRWQLLAGWSLALQRILLSPSPNFINSSVSVLKCLEFAVSPGIAYVRHVIQYSCPDFFWIFSHILNARLLMYRLLDSGRPAAFIWIHLNSKEHVKDIFQAEVDNDHALIFTLESIKANAPWIRRIYVLQDPQCEAVWKAKIKRDIVPEPQKMLSWSSQQIPQQISRDFYRIL